MYTLAGSEQALNTVEKMAGWVRSWSDPLSEQQMQRVLLVEYGGMGEVLANLYGVTRKARVSGSGTTFRQEGVLRSACGAPRRTKGFAREHPRSSSDRCCQVVRAHRRQALLERCRLLLGRSYQ